MSQQISESIEIAADPDYVYDLVSDVGRMGEWSPEATGARGAPGRLKPGDRFIGTNRWGVIRWSTTCRVRRAERGVVFEFDVGFGPFPVACWRYEFTPTSTGTRVVETWIDQRYGLRGAPMKAVGYLVVPGNRVEHNRAGMRQTLRRLKQVAESTS